VLSHKLIKQRKFYLHEYLARKIEIREVKVGILCMDIEFSKRSSLRNG
jgi:hypothetical protein